MIKRWTIFDTSPVVPFNDNYSSAAIEMEPVGTCDTLEEAEQRLAELFDNSHVSGAFLLILPTYHKA